MPVRSTTPLPVILQGPRLAAQGGWDEYFCLITTGGTHTLRWKYTKDGSGSGGSDCAWVDHVQWSGYIPVAVPTVWDAISYTYDTAGRRIAKAYDDTTIVKYLYDGDHCIAEYDSSDQLLRKFIHGPGVDQPICMIEVADAGATYYYHFDGLGSVVALSDEDGDTVQLYEYSVYGRVAASDPNHTNPFMFTGRRFDADTGLYYYRARYYNPYIGRFLQTDPIDYGRGVNLYTYCWNNPLCWVDSSGREPHYPRTGTGVVINPPGTWKDQWIRESKVASPHGGKYAHPTMSVGGFSPYYDQHYPMSCSAVGILNWWLTYDVGLPKREGLDKPYATDWEAEDYVLSLLGPNVGFKGVRSFTTIQSVMDPGGENTAIVEIRTREAPNGGVNLADYLEQERGVVAAIDLDPFPAREAWHVIVIVPTPVDILAEHEGYGIMVINQSKGVGMGWIDENGSGRVDLYTREGFVTWWNGMAAQGRVKSHAIVAEEDYKVPRPSL